MPKVKGKKDKIIHPNSRAAAQLARQAHRDGHIEKKQKEKNVKLEKLGEKLLWFQERLDPEKKVYTKDEMHSLCCQYMDRFAEELEQIDIVNSMKDRTGFQHQGRKDAIKMTQEKESNEFSTVGLEVPDLLNGKVVQYFREWNGELRFVQNIALRRIKKNDGKKKCEKPESSEASKATDLPKSDNPEKRLAKDCKDKMEAS